MTLNEFVTNYVFGKASNILLDGTTTEKVKEALAGLNTALSGLSRSEMTSMVESTTPLKSFVDLHTTEGIQTREKTLSTEFDTEKRKNAEEKNRLELSINNMKSRIPMSADPAELRTQALDEPDVTKREILNMRADNIEFKNQLAERTAIEEKQLAELTREKLVNVGRNELGDRKLPKFITDNLHMYVGTDEETTKGKFGNINTEWDDFTKDMRTAGVSPGTPPAPGESERDVEEVMNEQMSKVDF